MQQGLGRCAVTLRESDNIGKYRDIVLWGCLHNLSYDTQCEGTRAAYVYQLVSCFHDDAYFAAPTIDAFLSLPPHLDCTFDHFCELLRRFAENGYAEAKNVLYKKYDILLASLTVKRSFRSYDYERDNFERVCISLTSLDGEATLLKIAEDMGALFKRNRHYDGGSFDWFFADSESKFGKNWLSSFLKREAKRSENVLCLYENYQRAIQDLKNAAYKPIETPCAENIISETDTAGELSPASRVRFSKRAEDAEKMKLALSALAEKDLFKKAELLSAFCNEEFPIQHETIIEYSKSDCEKLSEVAFCILTNCRSTAVRQYACELLDLGENTDYAIQMLISNYTPDDKAVLLSTLYSLKVNYKNESDWHGIGLHILAAYDRKIRLPKECLLYIYETTLCSCCRVFAVRKLAKHRWLTADIVEECRYDSNYEIADYVNRYYPSK